MILIQSQKNKTQILIKLLNYSQGDSYPATAKRLFTSGAGLKTYAQNTLMFAPGEGLRMMMCFGTKDYIMPKIGGDADPRGVQIPM
jgi:hypothetical protein